MEYTEKSIRAELSRKGVHNIQLWKVDNKYVLSGHAPGKPLCVGRGASIQQAYEDFLYEWHKREVIADARPIPF